jgi:hypothetical protein
MRFLFASGIIILNAVLSLQANAGSLNSIKFETYGADQVAMTIEVDRNFILANKIIDAFAKSPLIKPCNKPGQPPEILCGENVFFDYSKFRHDTISIQLKFDFSASYINHSSFTSGVSLQFRGPTAVSLYAILKQSTSNSVSQFENSSVIEENGVGFVRKMICSKSQFDKKETTCEVELFENM